MKKLKEVTVKEGNRSWVEGGNWGKKEESRYIMCMYIPFSECD